MNKQVFERVGGMIPKQMNNNDIWIFPCHNKFVYYILSQIKLHKNKDKFLLFPSWSLPYDCRWENARHLVCFLFLNFSVLFVLPVGLPADNDKMLQNHSTNSRSPSILGAFQYWLQQSEGKMALTLFHLVFLCRLWIPSSVDWALQAKIPLVHG